MGSKAVKNLAQSHAIILIDATERRQAEHALYLRYCEELTRETETLRTFEEADKPAFAAWFDLEFPAFLEEYRSLDLEVQELQCRVGKVFAYSEMHGVSHRNAYRTLQDIELYGEEEELFDERAEPEENFDQDSKESKKESQSSASEVRQTAPTTHVKSIYRQLVRKLHPDLREISTERETQLWHEVQKAYTWRDIQKLETILKELDGGENAELDLSYVSIGDLIEFQREIQRRLGFLRYRVKNAKKDPSWEFAKTSQDPKQFKLLKKKLAEQLEKDRLNLKNVKTSLEEQLDSWENSTHKVRNHNRKSKPKKVNDQSECFDF